MSQVDQPSLFWRLQFGSIFRLVHSTEFQGVLYHRIANFFNKSQQKKSQLTYGNLPYTYVISTFCFLSFQFGSELLVLFLFKLFLFLKVNQLLLQVFYLTQQIIFIISIRKFFQIIFIITFGRLKFFLFQIIHF